VALPIAVKARGSNIFRRVTASILLCQKMFSRALKKSSAPFRQAMLLLE
jgi:hypothetical protein